MNGKEGKKKKKEKPVENPKGGFLGGLFRFLPSGMKDYTGGGSMRTGGGVDESSPGPQARMKKKKKTMMA